MGEAVLAFRPHLLSQALLEALEHRHCTLVHYHWHVVGSLTRASVRLPLTVELRGESASLRQLLLVVRQDGD